MQIICKRADGFHEIASVFCPVGWSDVLEINPAEGRGSASFTSTGIPVPPSKGGNLCEQAYQLLAADFPHLPSVRVHLHKHIPIGAGLGGGSSDGAQTLVALNDLFALGLSSDQLRQYAARLGSDCAFFVDAIPAMATGRGEVLAPFSIAHSNLWIKVIYPGLHISTAEAYAGVVPTEPKAPLESLLRAPIKTWRHSVHNQFEDSLFPKYPVLPALKDRFYQEGAVYASMTGSGSAVYGLFEGTLPETASEQGCPSWEGPVTWGL